MCVFTERVILRGLYHDYPRTGPKVGLCSLAAAADRRAENPLLSPYNVYADRLDRVAASVGRTRGGENNIISAALDAQEMSFDPSRQLQQI